MKPERQDAPEFRTVIKHWRATLWGTCQRWSYRLFHHTPIQNAAEILRSGVLKSRVALHTAGVNFVDVADTSVMSHTSRQIQNSVRFYFRPRTPTLYHVEGIRPAQRQIQGKPCAVPVYFLFDLARVLCREGTLFTAGNASANGVRLLSTPQEFATLPFDLIYHEGSIQGRHEITHHRQAEVLVPHQIELVPYLRTVVCRSQAELETLRHLLDTPTLNTWWSHLRIVPSENLFFRYWGFVDEVTLGERHINIKFNPPQKTQDRGPFKLRAECVDLNTNHSFGSAHSPYQIADDLVFTLPALSAPTKYLFRLSLDDHLVYANTYEEMTDLPF